MKSARARVFRGARSSIVRILKTGERARGGPAAPRAFRGRRRPPRGRRRPRPRGASALDGPAARLAASWGGARGACALAFCSLQFMLVCRPRPRAACACPVRGLPAWGPPVRPCLGCTSLYRQVPPVAAAPLPRRQLAISPPPRPLRPEPRRAPRATAAPRPAGAQPSPLFRPLFSRHSTVVCTAMPAAARLWHLAAARIDSNPAAQSERHARAPRRRTHTQRGRSGHDTARVP
jgi:hypothetical protein